MTSSFIPKPLRNEGAFLQNIKISVIAEELQNQ
jgi:hypothetical protein